METGKTNLIIGTSGSGKTVLQKCLVGLFEPDEGNILYDGVSFTEMNEDERKMLRQQIGMLFQGSALFDSMTVEENIKLAKKKEHYFLMPMIPYKTNYLATILQRLGLVKPKKTFTP